MLLLIARADEVVAGCWVGVGRIGQVNVDKTKPTKNSAIVLTSKAADIQVAGIFKTRRNGLPDKKLWITPANPVEQRVPERDVLLVGKAELLVE